MFLNRLRIILLLVHLGVSGTHCNSRELTRKPHFCVNHSLLRCTKKSLQTLSWYKLQNLEMHRANLVCHLSTAFYPHTREKSKCANMLTQSDALCLNKHLCCQIRLAERDNKHRAENPLDVLHLNQTEARTDTHRHPPGDDREVQLP